MDSYKKIRFYNFTKPNQKKNYIQSHIPNCNYTLISIQNVRETYLQLVIVIKPI